MKLRPALLLGSTLMIAAGAGAALLGRDATRVIIWGCVIFVALLVERWRYRPPAPAAGAETARTGERFVDPDSGVTMEVTYDPRTGERGYVEAKTPGSGS